MLEGMEQKNFLPVFDPMIVYHLKVVNNDALAEGHTCFWTPRNFYDGFIRLFDSCLGFIDSGVVSFICDILLFLADPSDL